MSDYQERLANAKSTYTEGLRQVENTPTPKGQKFPPALFVKIGKDLGATMQHFDADRYAMVEYTHSHAYGGSDVKSYSLLVRYEDGWSSVAWYDEWQLSLVTDEELINKFKKELQTARLQKGKQDAKKQS